MKPILFSADNIRRVQELFTEKEAFAKSERERINAKKAAQALKKQKENAEKAANTLQAVARAGNIDEVRIEEKAQLQAQKKNEARQKKVLKALPVRIKTPAKPRKALVKKKKVVRFIGSNITEGVPETPVKQSSRGRTIKPQVIFEKGSN
jgi:hypothetical protein